VTAPAATATAITAPAPRPRIAGLDGLRALAVIGVMLYHADVGWAQGGFLGVDVFFVLSGYLVTSIVVEGIDKRGTLGFRRFWSSRMRRLAPAQVAVIAVTVLVVALWHPKELADLRGQAAAALTGTTNWYLIATKGSYFEQLGRPPVLRHLWSLAIELQFYLLFPLVLAVLWPRMRNRLGAFCLGLAVAILASGLYLALLFHPGVDPSRAYYDTFARLEAPLVGALLAILWRPAALRRAPAAAHGRQVSIAGGVALLALLAVMWGADDRSALLYRGGFVVVALLTAVVVAALTHPNGLIGGRRGLGHPALVAIGVRSYGLYLWHWPVYALLRPRIDVGWSWGTTLAVRVLITVVLTELCYRFVERPWHLRSSATSMAGLAALIRGPRQATPVARGFALSAVTLVAVAAVIVALPHKPNNQISDTLRAGEAALASSSRTVPTVPPTTIVPGGGPAPSTTAPPAATGPVTLIGDSVMVGAAPDVLAAFGDRAIIDAKVARQADAIPAIIRKLAAQGKLAPTVVVQVGINGTVTEANLDDIANAVAGRRLFILNARVPRSWEQANNNLVNDVVPTLPQGKVIDWYDMSNGHRDWFLADGVHLTAPGRTAYADLIETAVDH
jgi:peptidoglycan/LPS O-acetylase OafA/YrhL